MRARDEGDEKEPHATHSSGHVSPASRLYRHALEAILGMLTLDELIRILAVSRDWSAAVRSMKTINAVIHWDGSRPPPGRVIIRRFPPIERLVGSPLLRHLATIHVSQTRGLFTSLDNASLGLLAQLAPNLTSLWCELTLTPNEPLILPANLQSLRLEMFGKYTASAINGVLSSLASLPSLSRLTLDLQAFRRKTPFALSLLAASSSLSDLTLESTPDSLPSSVSPKLTSAQVDQIRMSLGHLHHVSIFELMDTDRLAGLLQLPVTARWQDIGHVAGEPRTGELLLRLPSLTKLVLIYTRTAAHVDFLPQLTRLTALDLDCFDSGGNSVVPADAVFSALLRCIGLTELLLRCGFNSAQWSALLAKLPLKKLMLVGEQIDTLRSFEAGHSLQDLSVRELLVSSPSDLSHLSGLRRLRTLELYTPKRVEDTVFDILAPPTSLLPALTKFVHHWWNNKYAFWECRERQGPSFECMQQRLTQ